MPVSIANGVEIYFETYGNEADPPLLLVCGLGMQMVSWGEDWFEALVGRGFFVVAFDNRDAGFSTHLVERGTPDFRALLEGREANISYGLSDMADDTALLIDHLGLGPVHVLGISMGGMIAQQLAIDHPRDVRSLCSIMSSTGDWSVGQPSQEAAESLLGLAGSTREEVVESSLEAFAIIGSPAFPPDEARMRRLAGEAFDRSNEPTGISRQMGAVLASPDRTQRLGALEIPALVIHGASDTLINPSGGEATAKAIPGAELVMVDGMGHDLPLQIWDEMLDAIAGNARRADAGRSAKATSA